MGAPPGRLTAGARIGCPDPRPIQRLYPRNLSTVAGSFALAAGGARPWCHM